MSKRTRPYRITEQGRTLATATSYQRAQAAVARRIASDVEGRVLVIEGPDGLVPCRAGGALGVEYGWAGALDELELTR